MTISADYVAYIRDQLAAFEPLRVQRMFGAAGIYSGDLFFAIIADDELYLKVDDHNRADYEARGIAPFEYETKAGRKGSMSYYAPPPDVLEDSDAFGVWVTKSLDAARRVPPKKKKRKRSEEGWNRVMGL